MIRNIWKFDDRDVARLLIEASRSVRDYSWHGKPEMRPSYGLWAICLNVHRDSDVLTESNWQVITADMTEQFPENDDGESDVFIAHMSHWAVGWIDHLMVKMYTDSTEEHLTDAAIAMIDRLRELDSYPIADEEHYSNHEFETAIETIYACWSHKTREDVPESWPGDVYSWLEDCGYDTFPDCINDSEVIEALTDLKYIETE